MRLRLGLSLSLLLVSACSVGPDYEKPLVETPAMFKEALHWKPVEPQDDIDRGPWWELFQDPVLNVLEKQVDVSNQNLKQAEAGFRAAIAVAEQNRSALFPVFSATKASKRTGFGDHNAANTIDFSAGASWTVDLWGKIRRQLEGAEASAEVSAADVASARLSAQAQLARTYFALRVQDQLLRLLQQTVKNDEAILRIVENQGKSGIASPSDVLAAQTALENARASAINAELKRAQSEHAIAVLIGQPPAEFRLEPLEITGRVPLIPPMMPSTLLERRPDIAGAERQVAVANADVGIAVAAYFPQVSWTGSYGLSAAMLGNLFKAASTVWSYGLSSTETLFDFGARRGARDEAEANYDRSVAAYRQTVLTAFQDVEDNLAAQRILREQEKAQTTATATARRAETVALNQYKEGVVPYNTVLSAQITRLGDEQASLTVLSNRLAASVSLIEALGGGWETPTAGR